MINTHNITFSKKIIIWYKTLKKEKLPWQLHKTTYHIWLSEIMLQQTQIKTVIPYYKKFIKKFPTIDKLASAQLNEILYLWSGLGYYVRAENLHKTAKIVIKSHYGIFPEDFNTLITLPGIGRSTAGAILSLALNKKYPILDSNIKRILLRYYALNNNSKKSDCNNNLWNLIQKLLPNTEISTFNQAIMNLGQLICTNRKPTCNNCPIHNNCQAYLKNKTQQYLITHTKKINQKTIWLLLLLQSSNKTIWLEQRLKIGIWKKLFCFPEFSNFNSLNNWISIHNLHENQYEKMDILKYKLSNINLEIRPILLKVNKKFNYHEKNGVWYKLYNPPMIGIPRPISRIIKELQTKYHE